ncbi:hypothetical protein GORHZ_214_00020 [Gordonia rhizosphera NBRC 16068]|uniref:DUF952 domain-containing protein n=1 Tax=Gordonia rhizosphera NBRC 16068 TaxID=1108045 RepID=K6X3J1_9ACTN|nr:hypothetical protein GORHZ_214_00020 [Gordonia rhizosphera NBRC 16068]
MTVGGWHGAIVRRSAGIPDIASWFGFGGSETLTDDTIICLLCGVIRVPQPCLLHLISEADWSQAVATDDWAPAEFDRDGFVHLSAPGQVHLPANRIFSGRHDLLLLILDPALLGGEVRWEPGVSGDPTAMLFPHLYGRLPIRAVVEARPYRPTPDGTFPPLTTR